MKSCVQTGLPNRSRAASVWSIQRIKACVSVQPQQRQDPSARQRQVDVVDGPDRVRAAPGGVDDAQALHPQPARSGGVGRDGSPGGGPGDSRRGAVRGGGPDVGRSIGRGGIAPGGVRRPSSGAVNSPPTSVMPMACRIRA